MDNWNDERYQIYFTDCNGSFANCQPLRNEPLTTAFEIITKFYSYMAILKSNWEVQPGARFQRFYNFA